MLTGGLIQASGDGTFIVEMKEAKLELERRGVPVVTFHPKRLLQRKVALDPATLVVAEVPYVEAALKQLGHDVPVADCYPEALRSFLRRAVWTSTLGAVESAFAYGAPPPVFVKPKERIKRFTGFVADGSSAFVEVHGVSKRLPVWCSDVVSWRTEHRAFVARGEVLDVRYYAGDPAVAPSREIIDACVSTWTQTGKAAHGYAIDFGVLASGETALVEVNDGYSIGSYGLAPSHYVDLLSARWSELVGAASS